MKELKKIGTRKTPFWAIALGLAVVVSGCGNPYRSNYLSTIEKWPKGVTSRVLPPTDPPKLLTSTDLRKDSLSMLESNHVMIGRSKFRSPSIDESQALDQAKKIGAWVVLVNHKYVDTVTESVPVNEYIPDQRVDTTETTVIHDGGENPKVILKDTSTVVQGEFRTTYMDRNTEYYDYTATFWAKAKPPLFGVLVKALDEETKASLGSNKGVLVTGVITGSPAWDADFLKRDILVEIAGEPIRDPDHFFDVVERNAGKTVTVDFFRDDQKSTKKIKLANE